MNIIEKYLYLISPLESDKVLIESFSYLKENGWYRDHRGSDKFEIFAKRFQIDDKWYRVVVRFERISTTVYKISIPVPFVIIETSTSDGEIFVDSTVHHGRKVKSSLGYIENGIPKELINQVINDLNKYLVFSEEEE